MKLYLRVAPELYLKRLLVGGMEKVYEINRNFRNEGISTKHNPEFTMLEVYNAYADFQMMMDLTEQLISSVAMKVNGSLQVKFEDQVLDFTPPWNRMTMLEAIKKYTGVDFTVITTDVEARQAAEKLGLEVNPEGLRGDIINDVFEEFVEEKLI
jgi:lysyl-tRNA synthetase class 2